MVQGAVVNRLSDADSRSLRCVVRAPDSDQGVQMPTLDDLNAMLPGDFITELDGVFEHAPWVAEIAASKRSFASVIALHEALMAAVVAAPPILPGFPTWPSAAVAESAR